MSKPSPSTADQMKNKAEWMDVSQDADAPHTTDNDTDSARSSEPPLWSLYLRYALCALVLIWVTEWVTTRRMIAERPPLRIEAAATVAPSETAQTLLSATETATPAAPQIMVHVTGAVKTPGVYEVGPRARLRDAVHLAGGPLSDADLEAVNLAEFLSDGQQYAIPQRREKTQPTPENPETSSAQTARSARVENSAPAPKVAVKSAPRTPKTAPPSAPLDLNSATAIELDTLPDIGPTKAARIVEYRAQNGAFKSVEDLVEVEGIGEKTLEKLRPYVVVR